MKNPIGICLWCEELFERKNGHQKYCSGRCVRLARNERMKRYMAEGRKWKPSEPNRLDDTLQELAEYNAEHGTHLSYGQYQLMKYKDRK